MKRGKPKKKTTEQDDFNEEELHEDEIDYEDDLEIDMDNLDQEWINQPVLFERYSKLHKQAVRNLARSHEKVKTLRSELIKEVNEEPDKLLGKGIKATAANAEAYYRTHAKYKKVKQQMIDAEYISNVLSDAVSAFRMRKTSLENLVQLAVMNYFSAPKEPKNINRDWSKKVEEARIGKFQRKIGKVLNKHQSELED